MKIQFDNRSYIEITKTPSDKVMITIAAWDNKDRATVANSVELTLEQFNKLITLQ
jgi:hypothetical protein